MISLLKTRAGQAIAAAAQPILGREDDYDGLLALVGDAHYVLLGEATHGTHEFYAERARFTQRLICDKGFSAVAVEADWPDAYRVNHYVHGNGDDIDAEQALSGFKRFPTWMWRNVDVLQFVEWLRKHNVASPATAGVGFYGLDLYSLFTSIAQVLDYLDQVDPAAAQQARARYACFDHFDDDSQQYAYAAGFGMTESCENAVIEQLKQLQQRAPDYIQRDGRQAIDAYFHAQQNARLIKNAERYYRTMFGGRVSSWNLRDSHMADTLDALAAHLGNTLGQPAKIVVWEHNSHIGDARATDTARRGEWNVGQLVRERHGALARLIGFTTFNGSVTAASRWDGMAEHKLVRDALPDSVEYLFHHTGPPRFMLPLIAGSEVSDALLEARLERAIGVIYQPQTERQSHYFYTQLPRQFDAVLHFDRSSAVQQLESIGRQGGDAPETYPVGV